MPQNQASRNNIQHSLFDLLQRSSNGGNNPPAVVSYSPSTPSASQIVDSFFDLNGPTESAPAYLARALARADASRQNNNVNEHQRSVAGQDDPPAISEMKIDSPKEDSSKQVPLVAGNKSTYFGLLHQPNEKQRKSYKKENRYILPNPMTVCLTKSHQKDMASIRRGSVTVKLLYETGDDLEENRKNILEGTKSKTLDSERSAQFHLKIKETSERSKFRLHFTVRFEMNGEFHVEQFMSHSFRVTSNKKNSSVEKPKPFAIQPPNGYTGMETEVWIRGSNFTDRAGTSVKFGGKEGRVIETEDNLLICYAPVREDLADNTVVDVEVSNFHPDFGPLKGTRTIKFSYLADKKRKKSKGSGDMEPVALAKQIQEPVNEEQAFQQEHLKEHDDMILSEPSNGIFQSPRLEDIIRSEFELARLFPHYASEAL